MTATAHNHTDDIPTDVLDRIIVAVDFHATQARRSAVRTDKVSFRRWVLRGARRVRFLAAWGL